MKNVFLIIVILLSVFETGCVIKDSGNKKEMLPLDYAKLISNSIISNTYYGLIDFNTGEKYNDLNNLPDSAYFTLNPYVRWVYMNGVLGIALVDLAEYTGDRSYIEYLGKVMDFRYDNYDLLKRLTDDNRRLIWMSSMYSLCCLDACGAMGASMMDIYKYDKREEYKNYVDSAAEYVFEGTDHLKDGTIARTNPVDKSVWLDDLYMSVPFLVRYGQLSGDDKYIDMAATQVILFTKYLYDESTGLYFHCYFDTLKQTSTVHWGRANGWSVMAQCDLLEYMPENYPLRDSILNIFRREIKGLSGYQSESGMWHQILDKNDSYLETSASSMFVYAIAKGINEGWLDKIYTPVAINGWKGLQKMITDKGDVKNICVGTGVSTSPVYYYERPVELNDLHGLGSVIMAAIEVNKLMSDKK